MKKILFTLVVASCALTVIAQDTKGNPPSEIVKYYFVDLLTNLDRHEIPKDQVDSIQRAHMANIGSMIEEKVLMLAGPFEGGGGIFILKLNSMEEAEELIKRDPAIAAGRLKYKIREWYTAVDQFTAEEKFKN